MLFACPLFPLRTDVFSFYSVIGSGGCGCGYTGACKTPGRAPEPLSGERKIMVMMVQWFDDMIDGRHDAVNADFRISSIGSEM
jgi:hypothetical protein